MDSNMQQGKPSHPSQAGEENPSKAKKPRPRPKNKTGWLSKGTGEMVASIKSSQLAPSTTPVTSSCGYQLVCSYNWVKDIHPTIYVPGAPPKYVARDVPLRVSPDAGWQFVDQNGFRLPEYPFEVVFRAAQVMNPSYRFDDVDVLLNRNTMRKLLDFARGSCKEAFRINMFAISNTLIIERCEESVRRLIGGTRGVGWGHHFETAITELEPDMLDISGHHRVLEYDFGGIKCAVRFEVDASYQNSVHAASKHNDSINQATDDADLAQALSTLNIQQPPTGPKAQKIRVIPRGSGISQTAVAEIKSAAKRKRLGLVLPQLWFGRTQYLIQGVHTDGVFDKIEVSHTEADLQRWENGDGNQTSLRKVAALLAQLRDLVKGSKDKACVAVCRKTPGPVTPVLQIFTATQRKTPLPKDIRDSFWVKK